MFQKLVSHNDDLRRLLQKGYAIAIDSNCLIIRDVPYLDKNLELRVGSLVAKLEFVDRLRVKQTDHQVFFAGGAPHGLDGRPIPNLGGGAAKIPLSEACADVVVQRSFSNKPRATGRFVDFFEKIESYVAIISGPAMARYETTPYTFRASEEIVGDSVFKYNDTLTSRAEITELAQLFANEVVAVIGLGGTGSYVFDFVAKTPVQEVRGFDRDTFRVHNAFRSPGRLLEEELGVPKADVTSGRYHDFRHGVTTKCVHVDASSADDFDGVTFAFVCVDDGESRAGIFELLMAEQIPFIDVGMGLSKKRGPISGMLRVTHFPTSRAPEIRDMDLADLATSPDDVYRTNIQIGELNALNACMAVVRYKQLKGFYYDAVPHHHLLFDVTDFVTVREVSLNED